MTNYLAVLGRQPALGLAELESLYGGAQVQQFSATTALVEHDAVDFNRLGGSIKLAVVLEKFAATSWKAVESYLLTHAAKLPANPIDGKLQLGLSVYDLQESTARINATGLSLKKALRKAGYSVRLVPNQTAALSSAQVFHNHLAGNKGLELIITSNGQQIIIARTQAVQNINAYTERDRLRPKRDARVGMLPPKLAQIIINLAVGSKSTEATILDPFCGTGVVLQEAICMGYQAEGSDIEARMTEYSEANLRWLLRKDDIQPHTLTVADATNHSWDKIDVIACETYLGRPFTAQPDQQTLAKNSADCNLIIKKFLRNVASQTKPGFRLCTAVPAWQIRPNEFKHLPLIDQIEDLGYNRVRFEHVQNDQLLYYREDQIVARELLILTRQ